MAIPTWEGNKWLNLPLIVWLQWKIKSWLLFGYIHKNSLILNQRNQRQKEDRFGLFLKETYCRVRSMDSTFMRLSAIILWSMSIISGLIPHLQKTAVVFYTGILVGIMLHLIASAYAEKMGPVKSLQAVIEARWVVRLKPNLRPISRLNRPTLANWKKKKPWPCVKTCSSAFSFPLVKFGCVQL